MKRCLCFLLTVLMIVSLTVIFPLADEETEITVLFTHDTHDYLYSTETQEYGKLTEHGGAARLKTLLNRYDGENTIYLDAGDFSMGTLYQAAYSTDAYELRNLGLLNCAVTTFGNHEFDYGADGVSDMLHNAMRSGDPLPAIVQSNIDFTGELTEAQQNLKNTFDEYGVKNYTILNVGGYKIGVFGLVGLDCIECIQTDLRYINYIDAAKKTVEALENEKCDVIIAISHAGTSGDGKSGEDFDLAKQVKGIDIIISGHSHSCYYEPVYEGDTLIASCGEYLKYLGRFTFTLSDGKIKVGEYNLIPIDTSVPEDAETAFRLSQYKKAINEGYLADEGVRFDDVICHSDFDLISLAEMYDTHQEYTMGNVIADSYLYEARRNGINDIDVALVGLGTIRNSIKKGDITVADAFEICSLGVGADGSAGHPIVSAYITGAELKLMTELDASLGTLVSSIKMSYSGLSYTFNEKRIILDRVTDVHLVKADGSTEEIEDEKLYKVCANMYAINMLGMLNGLTKGILAITPKDAEGNPIDNFYDYSLLNKDGNEIKEWVAFKNYLMSFDKNPKGVPELPSYYSSPLGRKNKVSESGIGIFKDPGLTTSVVVSLIDLQFVRLFFCLVAIGMVLWFYFRKKKHQ